MCLGPSLANWRKGAYVFPLLRLETRKCILNSILPPLPLVSEGVEVDWHAPGAFPGSARGPSPGLSLAEGRLEGLS